ncbi:MAG: Ribosomal protein L25/L23 [Candidatus Parvarchaeum acidophilus ARMAN-5]|jgi:ribosomal protein L23|uniref:Large ribosomal subunit protein uL23 n=1 Tax=Candidatus Parvarchaeum acidophilus ARMAN-5 TaxID=662762 RepID=D6GWZ2_PARA5|nr:MAG: Ribosomal protein L25/L23 [Candidatus Parvarchaeum acidophilus ARMAN-5]
MEENLKYVQSVLSGEKSTRLMQTENKLSFIVSNDSNKILIKKEIENMLKVKVESINIINRMDSRKVAIVKLKPEYQAMDIATQLGLI